MKKEEAIKWIDDRMCCGRGTFTEHHPPNFDECWEAGLMAIEALKTEPIRCGECENYIDRRCIEANHHVAEHGNCMNVFGAKRRKL